MLVECWLDQAALLSMEISIDRKQAITKQETQIPKTRLYEVARFLNQEVAYVFRAEKQNKRQLANVDCCHTTIRLLHLAHKMQRVASKL
jgi:hypothetical protein